MSDTEQSNGKGPLKGIIVFAVVALAWTGFNYWRAGGEVKGECKEAMGTAESGPFCDCITKEILADVGILNFVPLIGRVVGPSDARTQEIGAAAAQQCLGKLTD